jgi:4-diphosphocytidyl-2-C-methyl-D-erythritol kinase
MIEGRVQAQAKINLRLRVLSREESGYHSIETILHRVELADDVVVRVGGSARSIDCRGSTGDVGPPERNLAYRAAIAYADHARWPSGHDRGFAIEIDKRIPVAGGMGGGSADAGAVLRILDALSPAPLGSRLIEIAAALGSDVPFMTLETPMALAWGRGEQLITLPALPARDVVAIIPRFGIATGEAYQWVSEDRGPARSAAWAVPVADLGDWGAIERSAMNDFDDVVFDRHPLLREVAARLRADGAPIAMLSGSGSTVIGVFPGGVPAGGLRDSTERQALVTRTATRIAPVLR